MSSGTSSATTTPAKSKSSGVPPPPPITTFDLTFERKQVRKGLDLEGATPQYPKSMRALLSTKELLALQEKATAGTDTKLCMLQYDNLSAVSTVDLDKFQNHVDTETFCTNVGTRALKFDFHKLLVEFPLLDAPSDINDPYDRFRNKKTVNLLKNPDTIGKQLSLHDIGDTIEWIRTYASQSSSIFLQDLQWSHEFLINCCDDELKESILSDLNHDFKPSESGGPLTFALIITKTTNLTEDAIEGLKEHFESFDLKVVPGENIKKVVKYFLYACIRLENNQGMSAGFINTLFRAFQTSSCPEFNATISQWQRDIRLQKSVKPTYKTLLKEVERIYEGLYFKGDWNGTSTPTDSGFAAQGGGKSGNGGQPSNQKSDFSNPTDKDIVSKDPLCYQRKMKNGRIFKWCEHCHRNLRFGRWSTTHFTHQHSGPKKEEVLAKQKEEEQANVAKGSTTSTGANDKPDKKKELSFSQQLSESMSRN